MQLLPTGLYIKLAVSDLNGVGPFLLLFFPSLGIAAVPLPSLASFLSVACCRMTTLAVAHSLSALAPIYSPWRLGSEPGAATFSSLLEITL